MHRIESGRLFVPYCWQRDPESPGSNLCFRSWYDEKIAVRRAYVIQRPMFDDELGLVSWLEMSEHFMGQQRNLKCYSFEYWEPVQAATET